ncbi:MAG: SPW repeat domain-containing protein [Bryobacteraceae bacterium]
MNTETENIRKAPTTSVWISALNVLAGIWLIIAPFILLYGNSTARINDIVLGIVIGVFALIRAFVPGFQTVWLSWLNALWGIWLIIGSFVLAYAGRARSNDILLGIIVLLIGLWSATMSEENRPVLIR